MQRPGAVPRPPARTFGHGAFSAWRWPRLWAFTALAVVAASVAAQSQSAASAATASMPPCLDVVDATPQALPIRLPRLAYQCLALPGNRPVLVGRGGPRQAPTVLLVHGLGQNAHRDWAPVVDELAERFQVVTVDLPGFGASPPPGRAYDFATLSTLLIRLLDKVAPGQRVHVVGHSLGAALSLALAHRHPERVERLVMVDAAGILLKPVFVKSMTRTRLPQIGLPPLDRLLRRVESTVHEFGNLVLFGRDDRYDFLPWLARNPDVRRALLGGLVQVDAAIGLVETDFTAAIRETRTPTTLIWGRDDRIAPLRTGELLASRLPQAQLQVMDGAGHTPMHDRPASFNRLLLSALAGPVPQRATEEVPAGASQGHGVCRDEDGATFTGRFDSITIERCTRVSISRAQIGQLVVSGSIVELRDSSVVAEDAALVARDSEVVATASQFRGRVAIRADNSVLDLAGVRLEAKEEGVVLEGTPSRLFFSVSEWQGRDYRGDAHFIWPRPAGEP